MLKGREIRGLPVFAGMKKEEMGRVQDLLINDKSGEVEGLVITGQGIWQKTYSVKMDHIKILSKKGVLVPNKSHIKRLAKDSIPLHQKDWVGSKLLSQKGEDKGTVADVLIKNGIVAGLEISAGLVGDLHQRRDFVPWQNVSQQGHNFVENTFGDGQMS